MADDDPCIPYGTCDQEDSRYNDNTTNPEANKYCPDNDPFVEFGGFKWWTNYHWSKESGTYVWEPFKSIFDPYLFDGPKKKDKLILQILPPKPDQEDQTVWRTSEVCTAEKLGYGTYLVTAHCHEASLYFLDKNAVFGAFTYQYYGENPNDEPNCHRELDALEVISAGDDNNAQFTIQPYDKIGPTAMHRFSIPANQYHVTIVMLWWPDPFHNKPQVQYSLYLGDYDLDHLPSRRDAFWSPNDANLGKYVPNPGCQRFHLNLWLMHGLAPKKPQTVTVSRFQFRPR
jgi:hypothetical protein